MARKGWNRVSIAIGAGAVAAALLATTPTLAATGHSVAGAAAPGHPAKSTTKWTRISKDTGLGIAYPGLFRTADGRLHVIWPSHDNLTFSLHYSTVGGGAKLLATGTILHNWATVSSYLELVRGAHGGMDAIFEGSNNVSPYNTGAMFIATSNSNGTSWKLVNGSLSHHQGIPGTDTAATTLADGSPVASWTLGSALEYHVGIDPNIPAKNPDQIYNLHDHASSLGSPTLVRAKNGAILAGWFDTTGDKNEGYWVAQILPKQEPKIKAPNSGGHHQNNGQPQQPVALVAREGGGNYLAYCVPTHVLACGHIALWRVGAARALTVPESSSQQAQLVAMSNGRGGHLWITWFNYQTNKIRVVRTNAAATGFGKVLTINAPQPVGPFSRLAAEGSTGPLDVIALEQLNVKHAMPAYFVTQIDP